jgi:hypothetical protein
MSCCTLQVAVTDENGVVGINEETGEKSSPVPFCPL